MDLGIAGGPKAVDLRNRSTEHTSDAGSVFWSFADFALAFSQALSFDRPLPGIRDGPEQQGRNPDGGLQANEARTYSSGGAGSLPFGGLPVRSSRSKPWRRAANERRGTGPNRGAAGRRVPQLRELGRQRHRSRGRWRRGCRWNCLVCQRTRLHPLDRDGTWTTCRLGTDTITGVLDPARYRRRFLGCNYDGGAGGRAVLHSPSTFGPQLCK